MAEPDTEDQTPTEDETPAPSFPGRVIWAAGVVALLLVAFAVVVVVTGRDLRSYTNRGGGMLPTIRVGEQINADTNDQSPQLSDIVVFHPPTNGVGPTPTCGSSPAGPRPNARMCDLVGATESSQTYVKRVVGLPGDRLALVDGHVIRNGRREANAYVDTCSTGETYCNFPDQIVVPAGTYYVLGDNRGASDDSRFWGPVKHSWIVGVLVDCSLLDSFCSKVH